jgi:CBS domain-containing protein
MPPSLAKSVAEFFSRHAPFSQMAETHLALLAVSAKLNYFSKGSKLLGAEDGPAGTLFVVQRGEVRSYEPGTADPSADHAAALVAGECFPLGALIESRAVVNDYVAVSDTFCYEFDRTVFDALLQGSPPFASFCTRRIAHLLQESRRHARSAASEDAHDRHNMTSLLATLVRRSPVTWAPETPLGEALASMRKLRIGSVVVVDKADHPIGIFTERDVLDRVVLESIPLDAPLSSVMTPNPATLDEGACAFDAALAMARHGIRHLPVTRGGVLVGVISERDLFSLQRVGMREVSRAITHAESQQALEAAAKDVRTLARNMLAQGMAVEQLTQVIVALNDRLVEHAIRMTLAGSDVADVDFCWIALGSEGRMEQTISTDQDNGLIFLNSDNLDADAIRMRLLPVAQRINDLLARIGFPLCKGGIMASNPKWCLSLDEWKSRFGDWLRNPVPEALLNAAIFFDFRPLYGNAALAETLRDWLLAEARQRPAFLRMLAANALGASLPLNFFGELSSSGTIDLKGQGARPFIDAARILALAHAVPSTHTVQRLRLVAVRQGSAGETDAMVDAFDFIQTLRLTRQFASLEDGGPPNEMDVARLNELDRRILKEALRQARKLQSRLKLDYAL